MDVSVTDVSVCVRARVRVQIHMLRGTHKDSVHVRDPLQLLDRVRVPQCFPVMSRVVCILSTHVPFSVLFRLVLCAISTPCLHHRTMHLCDRTSKGFRLSHRRIESTQRFNNKEEISSRSQNTRRSLESVCSPSPQCLMWAF